MTSTSSATVSTAMIPACSNSASRVTAGVAAAAVCDAAARCAVPPLPERTASTGRVLASCRATRLNLRGLPKDSR